MAKLTLSDVTGGYAAVTQLNANWALIEAALENTFSRDGTTPNNMQADIDLNSYDLNNVRVMNMTGVGVITNAKSVQTQALVLNGEAITTTTTLTGGLLASEVTYDAGNLDTKLDTDFIKTTGAQTKAGALTLSDLLTASNGITISSGNLGLTNGNVILTSGDLTLTAGNLAVTGNITVSGTVDGVNAADAVVREAVRPGHKRMGNMQLRNNDGNTFQHFLTSSLENSWIKIGPLGAPGVDTTWDTLGELPTTARALIFQLAWSGVVTTADTLADFEVWMSPGDITQTSIGVDRNQVFDWRSESEVDANALVGGQTADIIIPLDDDGDRTFRFRWSVTNLSTPSMQFVYRGFLTDG